MRIEVADALVVRPNTSWNYDAIGVGDVGHPGDDPTTVGQTGDLGNTLADAAFRRQTRQLEQNGQNEHPLKRVAISLQMVQ